MIKAKSSGVFLCVTEQAVYGAKTNGTKPPFEVRELFSFPIDQREKIQERVAELADAKSNNFVVSNVSISPPSRFVRVFDLDTTARKKNPNYYQDTLKSQFRIEPETHAVSILEADTGTEADLEKGVITRLLFCGASNDEILAEQNSLVDLNVFPGTLEISSVSTLGAISDYAAREKVEGAILVLDMSLDSSQAFIVRDGKTDVTRPISYGVGSMIPVVKQELGLKDEESAKRLFFSNTFDFTEVGPKLLRKLIRELQASTGFYEVQTGQTISHLFLPKLPAAFSWVGNVLAETLGVELLKVNPVSWLEAHDVTFDEDVDTSILGDEWFGLISLMCPFEASNSHGEAAE